MFEWKATVAVRRKGGHVGSAEEAQRRRGEVASEMRGGARQIEARIEQPQTEYSSGNKVADVLRATVRADF
eukprot:8455605-Pyramimonas_sp.AAC.1